MSRTRVRYDEPGESIVEDSISSIAGSASRVLPARASIAVIGAGIVGNCLVGHLAELGWKDLLLIDKGPLPNPGGSTGHASNFIFPTDHNREIAMLTLESQRQYAALGVNTTCGGIEVARTAARLEELRRRKTSARRRISPAKSALSRATVASNSGSKLRQSPERNEPAASAAYHRRPPKAALDPAFLRPFSCRSVVLLVILSLIVLTRRPAAGTSVTVASA